MKLLLNVQIAMVMDIIFIHVTRVMARVLLLAQERHTTMNLLRVRLVGAQEL